MLVKPPLERVVRRTGAVNASTKPDGRSQVPDPMRQSRTLWSAIVLAAALGVATGTSAALADDNSSADASSDSSDVESLEIHGYVEKIRIDPEGVVLSARMDTGATSSSLNAINQRRFRRGGERWIEFDILDPTDERETIRIQRPIERFVRIIRHEGEQRRPVVKMTFCIGTKQVTADTTLIDRTNLTYQALVGRAHLAGHVLVDSAERHLMDPACPEPEADT